MKSGMRGGERKVKQKQIFELLSGVFVVSVVLTLSSFVYIDMGLRSHQNNVDVLGKKQTCSTLKDNPATLYYTAGHHNAGLPIPVGYDEYGYNYQAHMFNGSYANAYLGRYGFEAYNGNDQQYLENNPGAQNTWVWPYRNTDLIMKWNDSWLANSDCDGDGLLDRHYGHFNYVGSDAWLTNHMSGNDDGENWTYFTKIVAAPIDSYSLAGYWYTVDGSEMGPVIWGEFATIQEVESGTGITYKSPAGPGFGRW